MEQRIEGFIQHVAGKGWQVWFRLVVREAGDDEVEYGVLMGTPTRIVQRAVSMMRDALAATRTLPVGDDAARLLRGERLVLPLAANEEAEEEQR